MLKVTDGSKWQTRDGGTAHITTICRDFICGLIDHNGKLTNGGWSPSGKSLDYRPADDIVGPWRPPTHRPYQPGELLEHCGPGTVLRQRERLQCTAIVTAYDPTIQSVLIGTVPPIAAEAKELFTDWVFADTGKPCGMPIKETK